MQRFGNRLEKESGHPGEVCLGVLDGDTQDEKFEVVLCPQKSGRATVELRRVCWGEGVGWYVQRTMPLPGELTGLRALLRRAQRLGSSAGHGTRKGAGAKVFRLPYPDADVRRPS
jgi:hypothetical protein